MNSSANPHQLVLRRDTATGMSLVGWAADLPSGRFEHVALVYESRDHEPPVPGTAHHQAYQEACQAARDANDDLLQQQVHAHMQQGWFLVPFDLANTTIDLSADAFGNYAAAAARLFFQLSHNHRHVWAVFQNDKIVHIRTCKPPRPMETLAYQVWLHTQLTQMSQLGDQYVSGDLVVAESGLWFCPKAP